MLLSKTCRYALQAATVLAERHGEPVQARELAATTGVPRNYLSKLLHQLVQHGILVSERGSKGGFRLAKDPSRVFLAEIVEPVDPGVFEQHCLLGQPKCSDQNPCLAHDQWKALCDDLHSFLEETSLEDLARRR